MFLKKYNASGRQFYTWFYMEKLFRCIPLSQQALVAFRPSTIHETRTLFASSTVRV